MKRKLDLLFIFMFLGMCGTAFANTVFTLTGAGGAAGNNLGGVYVAPYTGTLSPGVAPLGSGPLTVVCDDYLHEVTVWEYWDVQVTQFTPSANLSGTRFDNTAEYEEVFYLIEQMNLSSTSSSTLLQNAELQWAIWAVTDPALTQSVLESAIGNGTYVSSIESDIQHAEANYSGQNYSNFYIITPTSGQPGQEYISEVPEPCSMTLFASGLLALLRRRRLS